MEDLLISVIIPVYNCRQHLSKCIQSVQQQTHKKLEILLVDDGSKDESGALCDALALQDPRIRVIHQENAGAAAARKTGIQQASGQYLLFVDSDDWLDATYAEELLCALLQQNADLAIGSMRSVTGDITAEYPHYFPAGHYTKSQLQQTVYPEMLSAAPFHTFGILPAMWGKLFKRELALANVSALNGGITFGEDGCFTYAVLLDCNSICIVDTYGYNYLTNPASATHRFHDRLLADAQKLRHFLTQQAQDKHWEPGLQIQEYLAMVCNHTVFSALSAGYGKTARGRAVLRSYTQSALPKNILKLPKIKSSGLKTKVKFFLMKCNLFRTLDMLTKS